MSPNIARSVASQHRDAFELLHAGIGVAVRRSLKESPSTGRRETCLPAAIRPAGLGRRWMGRSRSRCRFKRRHDPGNLLTRKRRPRDSDGRAGDCLPAKDTATWTAVLQIDPNRNCRPVKTLIGSRRRQFPTLWVFLSKSDFSRGGESTSGSRGFATAVSSCLGLPGAYSNVAGSRTTHLIVDETILATFLPPALGVVKQAPPARGRPQAATVRRPDAQRVCIRTIMRSTFDCSRAMPCCCCKIAFLGAPGWGPPWSKTRPHQA